MRKYRPLLILIINQTLYVKTEMHHVAINDRILLAFEPHEALLLGPCLTLGVDEILISDDFGTDKAFFEVSMDNPGSLRSLGPISNRPGTHLFDTRSKISDQAEQPITGMNHSVEASFIKTELSKKLDLFLRIEFGDLCLNLATDGHHFSALGSGKTSNLFYERMLTGQIVFCDICDIENWLGGNKMQTPQYKALVIIKLNRTRRLAIIQGNANLLQHRNLGLHQLVAASSQFC